MVSNNPLLLNGERDSRGAAVNSIEVALFCYALYGFCQDLASEVNSVQGVDVTRDLFFNYGQYAKRLENVLGHAD
jgi:hypothetical protein